MRKISESFINDLVKSDGKLNPIYNLQSLEKYNSLIWEIRDNYISIYYKGGRLLEIWQKNYGYRVNWDINYSKINKINKNINTSLKAKILENAQIKKASDCDFWINKLDYLITLMDEKWSHYRKKEKFIQQIYSLKPPVDDLTISDFEYQKVLSNNSARFDLMGIRKINKEYTLSFIELKQGYNSVSSYNNASGLYKHYKDILQVVTTKAILRDEIDQTKEIFKLKKELFTKKLPSNTIADDKIEVLFVLANYKTGRNFSAYFEKEVSEILSHPKIEIKVDVRFQFLDVDETTKHYQIKRYSNIVDIDSCITKAKEFYN